MSRRGFTIAESIFSAVILCFVMMAIFFLFPATTMAQRKAELRLHASSIAQRTLEAWRCRNFSTLVISPTPIPLPDEEHGGVKFTSTILVYQSGVETNYLKGLRVVVSWSFSNQDFSLVEEGWVSSVLSN